MDEFSYLSVLISVILGLAVTQILKGFRGILLSRTRIRIYWPVIAWAVLLLLVCVQSWWAMFELRHYQPWTFVAFAVVLLQTILTYMLAGLVFPDLFGEEIVDLRESFYAHRVWFFAFGFFVILASICKGVVALRRVASPDRSRISCILRDDLSPRGVDATRIVSQGSCRARNGQLHSLYRYCLCAASLVRAKESRLAPGVLIASQRVIPTDERSGLLTRIATESVSLCVRVKSLTALLELESAIHRQPESSQRPTAKGPRCSTQRAGIAPPHAEGDGLSGVTRDGEANAFISGPAAFVGGVPLMRARNPWAIPEAST